MAILPFQIDPAAADVTGVVNGALHELPAQLASLRDAKRQVIPIPVSESM
jgi:hypothetical protein